MVSFTRMKEDLDDLTTQVKDNQIEAIASVNISFSGGDQAAWPDSSLVTGGHLYPHHLRPRLWDWVRCWE